jgi:hypothetical protein
MEKLFFKCYLVGQIYLLSFNYYNQKEISDNLNPIST